MPVLFYKMQCCSNRTGPAVAGARPRFSAASFFFILEKSAGEAVSPTLKATIQAMKNDGSREFLANLLWDWTKFGRGLAPPSKVGEYTPMEYIWIYHAQAPAWADHISKYTLSWAHIKTHLFFFTPCSFMCRAIRPTAIIFSITDTISNRDTDYRVVRAIPDSKRKISKCVINSEHCSVGLVLDELEEK